MLKLVKLKFYALIFWRTNIGEYLNKWNDIRSHIKYSFKLKENSQKVQLEAYIQKNFHVIEKGLALPKPRPGFGKQKIDDVLKNTERYILKYGKNELISSVHDTLREYYLFCENEGCNMEEAFFKNLHSTLLEFNIEERKSGGTINVYKNDIESAISIDFENFVRNRYSVRDFSNKDVPLEKVLNSINVAKYAPSVCNRQGWKLHYYTEKKVITDLLSLQNGNRGFSESINKLLIITGDIKYFTKYESNQLFVDGGLFSMNLILSLHSQGIGSIALNTDIPFIVENKMKKVGNIPDNERLIMYLGIGLLKDEFKVAKSQRKENDSILRIHT